ncbi:hypothetical protein [Ktedonospora formicarum]|uniref:hypothetical protein n=1 Tax=Ktedonospora formicarum TaxID=2778364 RepID=UPI001C68CADD|nr:hypothetical protein [Ktedonospora formicarum]
MPEEPVAPIANAEAEQVETPENESQPSIATDSEQGEASIPTLPEQDETATEAHTLVQPEPEQTVEVSYDEAEVREDLPAADKEGLPIEEASTIPSFTSIETPLETEEADVQPELIEIGSNTQEESELQTVQRDLSDTQKEETHESASETIADEVEAPEESSPIESEVGKDEITQPSIENEDEETQQDLRKHHHKTQEEKITETQPALPTQSTVAPEQRPIEDEPTIPLGSQPQQEDSPIEQPEQAGEANTPHETEPDQSSTVQKKKPEEKGPPEEEVNTGTKDLPDLVRKVLGQIWNN